MTPQLAGLLAAVLAVAAAATVLLRRDLARAARRGAIRRSGRVYVRITADTSGFTRAMQRAATATDGFERRILLRELGGIEHLRHTTLRAIAAGDRPAITAWIALTRRRREILHRLRALDDLKGGDA